MCIGARTRTNSARDWSAAMWAPCFARRATEKQIRRGVHPSTAELERAIAEYIDTVNEDPKPFHWHKTADEILASIKRFCLRTLETAAATTS